MIKSMVILSLLGLVVLAAQAAKSSEAEVEEVILEASRAAPQQDGESYQRVYEAFTKLMQNTANNSLGNVRRLVSRLNQLVGTPATATTDATVVQTEQKQQQTRGQQTVEENTEQILNRLDKVNKETDPHTLRQLNDDVSKLISTLNDSYLRNIRRVVERVNRVVGQPSNTAALHQSGDRLDDLHQKQPGFPGWDEFIVAVDRMQKSLAHFVRSSTRLVTSG